jgi:hypothetical protein
MTLEGWDVIVDFLPPDDADRALEAWIVARRLADIPVEDQDIRRDIGRASDKSTVVRYLYRRSTGTAADAAPRGGK